MARIIKYEFKKTQNGRKLILWQALARGQKAVLATATLDRGVKPAELLAQKGIQQLLPVRLDPQ